MIKFFNICAPAIIYLIFSITQIIIDITKGLYNTAFIKSIVTILITFLLNILCEKQLSIVSWIIVFIPFIFMTVITTIVLYTFGLDASRGDLNKCNATKPTQCNNDVKIDSSGNILIYDPEYNPNFHPVFYKSPNIIVPNPHLNDFKSNINTTTNNIYNVIPNSSSSPAYIS